MQGNTLETISMILQMKADIQQANWLRRTPDGAG
jgi:hypothetical protein